MKYASVYIKQVCESINILQSYHKIKSKFCLPDSLELEDYVLDSVKYDLSIIKYNSMKCCCYCLISQKK